MKEKDFKCNRCGKIFPRRDSLKRHILTIKCNPNIKNTQNKWSIEDIEYLMRNWEWGSKEDITKYLKRSWDAIQRKASLLYLLRKRKGDSKVIDINGKLFNYGINNYGYMILWCPSFRGGYIMAHRYIWELNNNRNIPKGYDIHHKDGNRLNNDINNLELVDKKNHYANGAINRLAKNCFEISDKSGFWDRDINNKPTRNIPEALMLIVTEISEAMEAYRCGNIDSNEESVDSMEEELADTMIRLLDLSYGLGLYIENAVVRKIEKNKKRDYKHGKGC